MWNGPNRNIIEQLYNGACPSVISILVRGTETEDLTHRISRTQRRHGILDGHRYAGGESWFEELLSWTASPRLRQIRLELESEERTFSKVEHAVETMKERCQTVIREDSEGNVVTLELDHSAENRMWELESGPDPLPQSASTTKRLNIATLVWNVVPAKRVRDKETRRRRASYPLHKFSCPSDDPYTSPFAWREQYRKEWEANGSLLEFGPGDPS